METNTKTKRRLGSVSSDSEIENHPDKLCRRESPIPARWPRFLSVSGTDDARPLRRCNAVAIEKTILGSTGSDKFKVTRLSGGDLLVEVTQEKHARSLLNLKVFSCCGVDYPVSVQPHRSLNSSKGVVRCAEFKLFKDDEEIAEILSHEGVIKAQRISLTKDGQRLPTGTVFLTFNAPLLPEKIKVGFMVVRVDPYIPNPMRCFKCQKFGHTASRCKRPAVCSVCAEEGHDDRSCGKNPKCVNCEGDHPAFSKNCPLWRQEKEIQELKVKNKVSYFEAKKLVLGNSLPTSYANIAKKQPSVAVGTQTDPVQTECHCTYRALKNSETQTPISIISETQTPMVIDTPDQNIGLQKKEIIKESGKITSSLNKPVVCRPPQNDSSQKPAKEKPKPPGKAGIPVQQASKRKQTK